MTEVQTVGARLQNREVSRNIKQSVTQSAWNPDFGYLLQAFQIHSIFFWRFEIPSVETEKYWISQLTLVRWSPHHDYTLLPHCVGLRAQMMTDWKTGTLNSTAVTRSSSSLAPVCHRTNREVSASVWLFSFYLYYLGIYYLFCLSCLS